MGKIVALLSLVSWLLGADMLEKNCLFCHQKQQIPTHLIYKRYLLKYSTDSRMEEAIFSYLQNPDKKNSIMPPEFFLKFPMKGTLALDEKELRESIQAFLRYFNVKKRLVLEEFP